MNHRLLVAVGIAGLMMSAAALAQVAKDSPGRGNPGATTPLPARAKSDAASEALPGSPGAQIRGDELQTPGHASQPNGRTPVREGATVPGTTRRSEAASVDRARRLMLRPPSPLPAGVVAFPEPTEREVAASALGRIGRPAVPSLIQALAHRDSQVRQQAALVLARIGPDAEEAVPQLTASLDDESEDVRKAAARALGQIGPAAADAVPALMRTLVQPDSVSPGSR